MNANASRSSSSEGASALDAPVVDEPIVGILSGMGPYAGLDLAQKIHLHTQATTDQEHLSVALLSYPGWIPDRSTYLFDPSKPDPTPALANIARRLEVAGATVAGVPCNTAHCPPIFDALRQQLRDAGARLRLVHMIGETARHLREAHPGVERVGVLSSLAVYRLNLYQDVLQEADFTVARPDEETQRTVVNRVIFDEGYGIKAQSDPVTERARTDLLRTAGQLREDGADAVILGCTEFPLALPESEVHGLPLVDPTRVLARALIREAAPEKLKPLARPQPTSAAR